MTISFPPLDVVRTMSSARLQNVDLTDKKKVISAALAVTIARAVMLPSSPVNDVAIYFRTTVVPEIFEAIGAFNEKVIIDTDYVVELTAKLYQARYYAQNTVMKLQVKSVACFMDRFFSVDYFLDSDDTAFLDKYADHISSISNDLRDCMNRC